MRLGDDGSACDIWISGYDVHEQIIYTVTCFMHDNELHREWFKDDQLLGILVLSSVLQHSVSHRLGTTPAVPPLMVWALLLHAASAQTAAGR